LEVGDLVVANETVVATLRSTIPSFHDIRSHEELQAALAAADAAVNLAQSEVRRIETALSFSRRELQRARELARSQTISTKALDKAEFDVRTNEAVLASAKAQLEVRRSERATIAARLAQPAGDAAPVVDPACCMQVFAPVTGRVLRVVQESETVLPAGAALVEIGDPGDLEVVADLLSTDAVQISVGAPVRVDGWGGLPIAGRVSRIEPVGFTKVSALGIEEQRVRTIIGITDPPEAWSRLGHDYRVLIHVTIWRSEDALTVPVGALFRNAEGWAVFVVRDGRAHTVPIKTGHRNNRVVEITSGLAQGDRVLVHPSDRITDGVRVIQRETS
jgi:HlyD family secretion protein